MVDPAAQAPVRRHRALVLAAGVLAVAVLVWHADLSVVRTALVAMGWGIVLILGQEAVAHALNALGWRFAFAREHAGSFRLTELVRLRIAGDAVNYLTPSATLAGEVARTAMLADRHGPDVRAAAVILAKSAQTMAQAIFITAGLCLVGTRLAPATGRGALVFGSVAVALAAALILLHRKSGRGGFLGSARANAWIRAVATRLRDGIRGQPGRLALSVLMFALAYAWGAFEAYWICWFLGHPVSLATAAMIEVLSITVDGLLFVVPAKIGTQEGGKMAVFGMLGLSTSLGLAFGIVRHVRELTWAGLGLLLCVPHARGRWSGAARAPGPTAPTS